MNHATLQRWVRILSLLAERLPMGLLILNSTTTLSQMSTWSKAWAPKASPPTCPSKAVAAKLSTAVSRAQIHLTGRNIANQQFSQLLKLSRATLFSPKRTRSQNGIRVAPSQIKISLTEVHGSRSRCRVS
jgi:hypothetical protein